MKTPKLTPKQKLAALAVRHISELPLGDRSQIYIEAAKILPEDLASACRSSAAALRLIEDTQKKFDFLVN